MKALAAAQSTPSLAEPKIEPERVESRDPRRRRSPARRGSRRPHGDHRQHAAPRRVAGDDQISFYKEGQEQYPVKVRVLENQRRDAEEIGRLTVPSATGPVRIDNIARDRARPRTERAAALEPPVHGDAERRRRARATRSTRRRTTSGRCSPA